MQRRIKAALVVCAGLAALGLVVGQAWQPSIASPERARSVFEDVITIYAGRNLDLPNPETQAWKVMLDASHYPPGTVFRLEVCLHLIDSSYIASLEDCATGQPIPGSEVSLATSDEEFLHGISLEFDLPDGPGLYQVGIDGAGAGWLDVARVRAVWPEEPVPTEKQSFSGLKSFFSKE